MKTFIDIVKDNHSFHLSFRFNGKLKTWIVMPTENGNFSVSKEIGRIVEIFLRDELK